MPGRTQAEHHLTFAGAVRALTTSARAGWGRGRKGGAWAFLRSWWWRRRSGPCGCSLLLIEERLRLPRSCKRSHDAEFRSLRAHPNHYSWRQFGDARGRLTNTSEIRNLAVAHGNRTHRGRLSAPATGFEDRASHQIRKRYRAVHTVKLASVHTVSAPDQEADFWLSAHFNVSLLNGASRKATAA